MTDNIYWHESSITKKDRQILHGHKSCILWFTGLSGSGKSTIANVVEQQLHQRGISTYLLDGDNVRHGLNADLGFSPEDRSENIRRIGETAKLFVDSGTVVLATFVSPYRVDRQTVRNLVQPNEFVEIYVQCSSKACESRDPKGLYKKARRKEIKEFTGISAPYEEPEHPEITVDSEHFTVQECAEQILKYLSGENIIGITFS
ncbi:adenylyl-sulfate kinase [Siminovitchia acidinfaciens]|uniref:Adenylyl-sulfate kinase n=1 Tax=Siminovitchia acidinfaciens TaxID=2321395 RepID=A0A429Y4G1_9BACI|nr:adenylyl-sulfate kinase [Siminovitchia acidinfaciens]RST76316.1 adenylyl-sulfate kinase [Siminovitchia acidinfaciens]